MLTEASKIAVVGAGAIGGVTAAFINWISTSSQ